MSHFPHANPWTNVVGLARTLLALSTISTLLFTPPELLFAPVGGSMHEAAGRVGLLRASYFLLFPLEHLEWARWIAIGVLAVVASGWRPRLTGLPHYWITASYAVSAVVVEGGDQIAAMLALLLLPVTLTDSRRWHWETPPAVAASQAKAVAALVALTGLVLVRIQMAAIYFNAGVAKMSVPEWADGTALYYWFTEPTFGMPGWMEPLALPMLAQPWVVTPLTWGVMLFEVLLAAGLVMSKKWWTPLLIGGIAFHVGIALIHGLVSFGTVMIAGLILHLRPVERHFSAPRSILRPHGEAARGHTGTRPTTAPHAVG